MIHDKLIVSPVGGFGNHLRWLLLLDETYNFNTIKNVFSIQIIENYNIFRGSDWPNIEDFSFDNLEDNIKKEIKNNFYMDELIVNDLLSKIINLEDKIKFIKSKVYPSSRTWHNWLHTEWRYRPVLDNIIKFNHSFDNNTFNLAICMTTTPELAYKSYLKFNSNLNNLLVSEFKDYVKKYNEKILPNTQSKNVLLLNSDLLFNEILDKNLYYSAISHFGLDDHYESANYILKIWFNLHKKAEKEIINDLKMIYEL